MTSAGAESPRDIRASKQTDRRRLDPPRDAGKKHRDDAAHTAGATQSDARNAPPSDHEDGDDRSGGGPAADSAEHGMGAKADDTAGERSEGSEAAESPPSATATDTHGDKQAEHPGKQAPTSDHLGAGFDLAAVPGEESHQADPTNADGDAEENVAAAASGQLDADPQGRSEPEAEAFVDGQVSAARAASIGTGKQQEAIHAGAEVEKAAGPAPPAAAPNAQADAAANQNRSQTDNRRDERLSRNAERATSGTTETNAIIRAAGRDDAAQIEAAIHIPIAETSGDEVADQASEATSQLTAASAGDARREARHVLHASGRAGRNDATGKGALGRADVGRFIGRVSRAVELAHHRGESLQVRLSPPELGSLRIEISVRGGVLTAHLEADTTSARVALLDNLPALRERLAEQNVRVERFDVDVRDESGGGFKERAPTFDDHRRHAPHQSLARHHGVPRRGEAEQLPRQRRSRYLGKGRLNLVV